MMNVMMEYIHLPLTHREQPQHQPQQQQLHSQPQTTTHIQEFNLRQRDD